MGQPDAEVDARVYIAKRHCDDRTLGLCYAS